MNASGNYQRPLDIQRAKDRFALSHLVARHLKLRKAGHEYVGLCPFHEEHTPSFRVNDAKGVYHCFGCGAAGDAIAFVMEMEGCTFIGAVKLLLDEADLPEATPRDRAAAARRDQAERAAAIAAAQAEWRKARSIKNSPAEAYLASRGIVGDVPQTVRFGWPPLWRNKRTGAPGRRCPALLLAAQNRSGVVVGVQQIFLTKDGKKADVAKPKLSLGQVRGCAVRLAPPARHIILLEGPEDGLTKRMSCPAIPVWITLGTGSMPYVDLPDVVERITLAGDNNAAGHAAVEKAREEYEAQGRKVDVIFPPAEFEDWNDALMGIRIVRGR